MDRPASETVTTTPPAVAAGLPVYAWVILVLIALRPSLDVVFASVTMPVGGLNLSIGFLFNLMLVGVAAVLAINALLVSRAPDRAVVTILIIWGPMLAAAVIASVRTPVPAQALQVLFNYMAYAAISLLALTWAPHIGRERLTMLIAASGIVPICTALFQAATGGTGARVMGTFPHPNILAFFILIYVAFLFHAQISLYMRDAGVRLLLWLPIALGLLALLLTGTRAAYAAMFAFLFLYSALRRPIYLVTLIILPPLALLVPGVLDRINDVASGGPVFTYDYLVSVARGDVIDAGYIAVDSGTWRRYLWQAAWPSVTSHPLLGNGLASFPHYSNQFFPLLPNGESEVFAHNTYLQLVFEGGGVLLIGFLWTYLASALQNAANLPFGRGELIFAMLLIVAYALTLASDNVLYYLSINLSLFFVLFSIRGVGADDSARWKEQTRLATNRKRKAANGLQEA